MTKIDKIRDEIQTGYDDIKATCDAMSWRDSEYDDGWLDALESVLDVIDKFKNGQMNNKDWIDLLSSEWNVSRTTARKMLHQLIISKKRDECNKAQNELHAHSAYWAKILIERKRKDEH